MSTGEAQLALRRKKKAGKGPVSKTTTWMMLVVAILLDLLQLFFTFFGFVVAAGVGGTAFQFVKDLIPIPVLDVVFATIAGGIAGIATGLVAVPALTPLGMVIATLITIVSTMLFWFWFLFLGIRMGDISNAKKFINMMITPIFDAVPLLGAFLPTITLMVGLTLMFENMERKEARQRDIVQ